MTDARKIAAGLTPAQKQVLEQLAIEMQPADNIHGRTFRSLEKKGLAASTFFPPDEVYREITDLGLAVRDILEEQS